uniref:Uncharacterized protein n=1 Tax=Vespula pensylvanica TaxID=30213 RepID=A0A834JK97_VESPE|nr:hypothetical protein H0235_018253 [Vespula pensylvanica]
MNYHSWPQGSLLISSMNFHAFAASKLQIKPRYPKRKAKKRLCGNSDTNGRPVLCPGYTQEPNAITETEVRTALSLSLTAAKPERISVQLFHTSSHCAYLQSFAMVRRTLRATLKIRMYQEQSSSPRKKMRVLLMTLGQLTYPPS